MLLARRGYDVLLVDKATFPSDTMSTHFIQQPGVARLARWGLLDRLRAANTPSITRISVHMRGVDLTPPPPADGEPAPESFCPRRTVLDSILVEAAVEAGAEFRGGFAVREVVMDGDDGCVTGVRGERDGASQTEHARIVIGADGMHSFVAKSVGAQAYNEIPSLSFAYYAYWSDVPLDGAELHFMEDAGVLAFPTNDGLACIAVGGSVESFHAFRDDIEANYMRLVDSAGALSKQVAAGKRETRFQGTADQPNFFRKPYGPGWALVGDAGYHRDFITGLGITDAFRDADLLAAAIDAGLSGRQPLEEALAGYERERNEIATPLYEFTTDLARLETPPSLELFMRFGAALGRT